MWTGRGGGGDGRGKCNCLSMFPGHFLSILLMTILGDPGAVSRVDKMFVVNRDEPGLVSILQ